MEKIEKRFSRIARDEVKSAVTLDPSLIGGICIECAGKLYDGSVRSRIDGMKKAMLSEE